MKVEKVERFDRMEEVEEVKVRRCGCRVDTGVGG